MPDFAITAADVPPVDGGGAEDLDSILRGQLADATSNTKGAALVAYNSSLSYPSGTVGRALDPSLRTELASNTGSQLVTYTAFGTGAVARTQKQKNDDYRGPKEFDQLAGVVGHESSGAILAAIVAAVSDTTVGQSVHMVDGQYQVSTTIPIDITGVTTSAAGRISITGVGNASCILVAANPNVSAFSFLANSGQSSGLDMTALRFQVLPQGDNVSSYVFDTGTTSTLLDFRFVDIYVNGMARGWGGQYVSGHWSGCTFDFMTDYGIHAKSKEFRKLEIVCCHFYRVKQRAIYIQGNIDSNGNPTDIADRDNGRGAGHYTLTGDLFDRDLDSSEVCQMVYALAVDNTAMAGLVFNGITPDSSEHPLDAMMHNDARYQAAAALSAWGFDRGVYYEDAIGLNLVALNIVKGNQAGSNTVGALTLINVADSFIQASIIDSGGAGAIITGCTDCVLIIKCTRAQKSGIRFNSCTRVHCWLNVVDANQGENVGVDDTIGVDIQNGCSAIYLHNLASYVTDVSQGQKINLRVDPSCSSIYTDNGAVIGARTGGTMVSDTGGVLNARALRGYATKASIPATIPNTNSSVTVNHNLPYTPNRTDFIVSLDSPGHLATNLRVSATTSTQITITSDTAVNADTAVIAHFDKERG